MHVDESMVTAAGSAIKIMLSVRISDALRKRLKVAAAERRQPMGEIVEEAIERHLEAL